MKGEAHPLIKLFDGSDKRFIIPLYQRNYDWKEENCNQLFEDLMKLHYSQRKSHFFGSIVWKNRPDTEDKYIIDGQQRITTVSLILIALVNATKQGAITANNTKLVDKIFNRYIVDEYQTDERKVRLKPIKNDMQAFDALIYKSEKQYIKESNVTRNYKFLYDKIIRCGLTLDDILKAIERLEIIEIQLGTEDDAQLIFESLNSTGLDLSEADKIRNYLLMSLSPDEQEDLYTRFWHPIEIETKYNPSPFLRDFLTMEQGKIGKIDKIYFIFKEYAESKDISRAALLEYLYHFAHIYSQIDNAQIGSKKLNQKINQLRTLDSTIAYPFFMPFLDYAEQQSMSEDEIYKVINIIETYWARRIICNMPSNSLTNIFATLHRDILKTMDKAEKGNLSTYADILVYILLKKGRSAIFPSDEEIATEFAARQVYKMPTSQRTFIIERLENQDSVERHDIIKDLAEKNITIEHIMPQTLSEKWKTDLGSDWERIHQQYLHTMANLTLTGYNSQYSNLSFDEKRDMENGFRDSAYRLNNDVKNCVQWTEKEILKRQQTLLKVIFKLWPMPTTNFELKKKEADTVFLDDDDEYITGRKIQAYILHDVRHNVNTWKEMIIQVCRHILREKRATIEWLCANETGGFYTKAETWNYEFAPNMYVWSDCSTATKMSTLRKLFSECNIPASELAFEFRNEQTKSDVED